jgi:guanosine-3',5'-bis(diphosphate) 3'-pyrophosphohydrolase
MKLLDISKVSKTSLTKAGQQLWSLLEPELSYLDSSDKEVVELTFWQMVDAHGEQRRKSGDFYITHPVTVCQLLASIKLDRDCLAGALMHDVPEDTAVGLRDLQKTFSKDIVFLISGITKLSLIKYKGEDRYAENLRRMFVAIGRDLRVIFIKLADRIHNLSTLDALPPEKATRIALESMEIYSPIAERLGMGLFKDAIDELSFPYVHPEEYRQLISLSRVEYRRREKHMQRMITKVRSCLETSEASFVNVYGRAKKYSSLYTKLKEKKSIDQIYDLVAIRVITVSVEDCYEVLSILHRNFEHHPQRVKDYIATPKPNGYQSLHTTLHDAHSNILFEVQIRTEAMHKFAEYGVAAHWSYKQNSLNQDFSFLEPERLKWISDLIDLGKEQLTEEEYLKYVKLDLFQDRIFVMTPKGDAINLPIGSTALDFAFCIHMDIGAHAVRAKVNEQIQKISYELKNGDIVHIETDKNQKPRRNWLQIVQTRQAARTIRALLRKQGIDV